MKIKRKVPLNMPQEIEAEVEQMVKSFVRPKFVDHIRFPDDIYQLTPQNVSELHGKYTKIYTFCNQALASAAIRITHYEAEIYKAKQKVHLEKPSLISLERWRIDHITSSDPEVVRLSSLLLKNKMKKDYLTGIVENFDRYLIALSRELSRRSSYGQS
jgi:hypothetical protein